MELKPDLFLNTRGKPWSSAKASASAAVFGTVCGATSTPARTACSFIRALSRNGSTSSARGPGSPSSSRSVATRSTSASCSPIRCVAPYSAASRAIRAGTSSSWSKSSRCV
nr:hypothetical protein [Microbispora sp. GKU 823]